MKGLERCIQNKEYVVDGELKDMMLLLHTNCKDCKEKILYHIQNLLNLINEIEPTYNYLLIDLSMKSKTNYLEKVDEIHDNSSVFGRLLNTSTDKDIPTNINKIFMNYILVINMLKKEYHYLITTLKSINKDLDNRHGSLDGLVKGLNLQSSSSESNSTSILDLDEEMIGNLLIVSKPAQIEQMQNEEGLNEVADALDIDFLQFDDLEIDYLEEDESQFATGLDIDFLEQNFLADILAQINKELAKAMRSEFDKQKSVDGIFLGKHPETGVIILDEDPEWVWIREDASGSYIELRLDKEYGKWLFTKIDGSEEGYDLL